MIFSRDEVKRRAAEIRAAETRTLPAAVQPADTSATMGRAIPWPAVMASLEAESAPRKNSQSNTWQETLMKLGCFRPYRRRTSVAPTQ